MTERKHDPLNTECGLNIKFPNGISDIADRYTYDSLCSCSIETPAPDEKICEKCGCKTLGHSEALGDRDMYHFDGCSELVPTTPEAVSAPTVNLADRARWWNRVEMEEKLQHEVTTLIRLTEMMPPQSIAELYAITIPNLVGFMYKELSTARADERKKFDAMLAQDIENMKSQKIDIEKYRLDLIEFNRCNKSNRRLNIKEKRAWNDAIDKNLSILEARRLSLNK